MVEIKVVACLVMDVPVGMGAKLEAARKRLSMPHPLSLAAQRFTWRRHAHRPRLDVPHAVFEHGIR